MAVDNPGAGKILDSGAKRAFSAEEKKKMVEAPGNVAAHRTVLIRRSTQIILFSLFVIFFFMTTVTSQHVGWVPKNLFMTLDFFNTLKNGIASHHVAIYALGPGLFILLLTLWGGRIFCGWICPLGTSIDIGDKLLFRKGRIFYSKKRSDTRRYRNWKYIYLLVGLGAIVYGVDILTFGDPISLITRTFTFCFYAPIVYIWNHAIGLGDQVGFNRSMSHLFGWEMSKWQLQSLTYFNGVPVLLMFMGVIGLSGFQERFWCRNLCPYGGLLALISKVSWLRHYIKMEGCIHCKKCEIQSRMGCYENLDKRATEAPEHNIAECIQCFRCETICPTDVIQIESRVPASIKEALKLTPVGTAPRPERQAEIDLGRRRVLASIGSGMIWDN